MAEYNASEEKNSAEGRNIMRLRTKKNSAEWRNIMRQRKNSANGRNILRLLRKKFGRVAEYNASEEKFGQWAEYIAIVAKKIQPSGGIFCVRGKNSAKGRNIMRFRRKRIDANNLIDV